MTIVGMIFDGPYIQIPIDSSRNALIPNTMNGDTTGNVFPLRRVHWTVNGQVLNFTTVTGTNTVIFYYGSPYSDSTPLLQMAAVVASATLSSGAGTVTLNFPSGNLKFTGITTLDNTGAHTVELTWSTSTGQSMDLLFLTPTLKNYRDIVGLDLVTSTNLTITIAGTGSDVVYVLGYYA